MNYAEADAYLQGRNKKRKAIMRREYLHRITSRKIEFRMGWMGDSYPPLATLYRNGKVVIQGQYWGWTTRQRANWFMPDPLLLWNHRGQMFLGKRGEPMMDSRAIGRTITIRPDKSVVEPLGQTVLEYKKQKIKEDRVRDKPRRRGRYWIRKAVGITHDRSKCKWRQPDSPRYSRYRCRGRRGNTQLGTLECGCVATHTPPVFKGTVQDILAEPNATVRTAKMKCYGIGKFFLDAKAKIIDEREGYQLMELKTGHPGVWNRDEDNAEAVICAVQMECPSTGQIYVNTVPPQCNTVPMALDWIFNVTDYLGKVGQQT